MNVLDQEQLDKALTTLDVAWSDLPGQGLVRVFPVSTFAEGLDLVDRVAALAKTHNHHPDITLRSEQVEVTLFTHDAGGVTAKDVALAAAIDKL